MGAAGWGGTDWTLTRDLEEAGSSAHIVGDTALIVATAVAGDSVEAQLGMVQGLCGGRDSGRQRQQLPFEAPYG